MSTTEELSRIGEVAGRLGVSPRTIKYYEELGLVEPVSRSEGGFRLYGERDVWRLERILRMKRMGYSLAAIRELLAARDSAQEATKTDVLRKAVERLRDREREVAARIRQMGEDLRRAGALREELQRDVALCERRIAELAEQSRASSEGVRNGG